MSIDIIPSSRPRGLLRAASIMSGGTLLSRVLGFVRDMLFARFFGTAASADAFVVAFRLPNMFRDLIGEGAANSSFIPVMTEYKEKRPAELKDFINAVMAWGVVILTGITVAGIVLAPLVVRLIAPGFAHEPGKTALAVTLTQIMFPYLIFIGLTAFFSAIQFTYGAFTMPALGPCLLNVVLIISTLASVFWLKQPLYGLAAGVLAGGALQLWFQWVPLKKHGVVLALSARPGADTWPAVMNNDGARQVGRLILPRLLGSGVYQLNIFVDTICASLVSIVGPGGISAIYYAMRIEQLPMGVFGVALASAVLPRLSKEALSADKAQFKATLEFALKNIFFIMLPMTITLSLLAEPLVRVIFQRGAFDAYSTAVTASALICFGLGLMGYGGVKLLVSAFHSLQDTRTPVKVALVSLAVNALLNVLLMFPLKIAGIALASAVSSVVSIALLMRFLSARLGGFDIRFAGFFLKLLAAGSLQAAGVWWLWRLIPGTPELWRLAIVIPSGALLYLLAAHVLRLEQVRFLRAT
ncbi:MAG: murein biosynthesis integral membrane protein MurJ [Candidatus Omnitrophica bacterium]|nr:murein biosynthesis integral membrane protein MurJ [Candidatus Omnitrophota bacterium]